MINELTRKPTHTEAVATNATDTSEYQMVIGIGQTIRSQKITKDCESL